MNQNNEISSSYIYIRNECFPEDLENNYLSEDSFCLDNSEKYLDVESNFKNPNQLRQLCKNIDALKSQINTSYPNLTKDEQIEAISIIQENAPVTQTVNECIDSESGETPFKSTTVSKTKKRGRKRKGETDPQQEYSAHDIYSEDNISVKIQSHYIKFIISFLNCIFPHLNYKKKIYNLDKEFKINITKSNVESLNKKTIGEIICNKISKKYTTVRNKENANKNIYEEIKNDPVLNKILNENYLVFFKKFYYSHDSHINLKEYGLNKNIIFGKKVKNFKCLLKAIEDKGDKYKKFIQQHVYRNYLPDMIFIC